MKTNTNLSMIFGDLFGTDSGAGMALAIAILSACGVAILIGGYAFSSLHNIERNY